MLPFSITIFLIIENVKGQFKLHFAIIKKLQATFTEDEMERHKDSNRILSSDEILNEKPIFAAYDTESFPDKESMCLLSRYWNGWIFDIDCLVFECFRKLNSKGLPVTLNTDRAIYTYCIFVHGNVLTAYDAFDMLTHVLRKPWLGKEGMTGFVNAVYSVLTPYELWGGNRENNGYKETELRNLIMRKFAKEIAKAKPYNGTV